LTREKAKKESGIKVVEYDRRKRPRGRGGSEVSASQKEGREKILQGVTKK